MILPETARSQAGHLGGSRRTAGPLAVARGVTVFAPSVAGLRRVKSAVTTGEGGQFLKYASMAWRYLSGDCFSTS